MRFDILSLALRTRSETVAELSVHCRAREEDVHLAVEELAAAGVLRFDGTRITYLHPEESISAAVSRELARLREAIDRRVEGIQALAESIPGLVEDWRHVGGQSDYTVPVDVYRGADALRQVYLEALRTRERDIGLLMPLAAENLAVDQPHHPWPRGEAPSGTEVRIVLSPADASNAAVRRRIREEFGDAVTVRVIADPPTWFWILGEGRIALPALWADKSLTSIAIYQSAYIGRAFRAWFDWIWMRAAPADVGMAGWEPLLRLISQGATIEAAARTLGLSQRTAQRRIADAMAVYGVPNLFALGAAWDRRNRADDVDSAPEFRERIG